MAGEVIQAPREILDQNKASSTRNVIAQENALAFTPKFEFPALALLVSGGHTQLVICRGVGDYQMIGSTIDDALGKIFVCKLML